MSGTKAGSTCSKPVNLLSLYPTLTQLVGVPPRDSNDGPSIVPLLANPDADWPHVSITYLNRPGNYGLSDERWRFIHYDNGDEELYDTVADRHEWNNLAVNGLHGKRIARLRALAPPKFAEYVPTSDVSLPQLTWHPVNDSTAPPRTQMEIHSMWCSSTSEKSRSNFFG